MKEFKIISSYFLKFFCLKFSVNNGKTEFKKNAQSIIITSIIFIGKEYKATLLSACQIGSKTESKITSIFK